MRTQGNYVVVIKATGERVAAFALRADAEWFVATSPYGVCVVIAP